MMRYSLRFELWPDADRAMWDRLVANAGLLEETGAGARWAPETRRVAMRDYGYWLSFVHAICPASLGECPLARVTVDRIHAYCRSMDDVSARTRAGRIGRLHAIVRGANARDRYPWLAEMRRALERLATYQGPVRSKQGRLRSSAELYAVGLRYAQEARTREPSLEASQAVRRRVNGRVARCAPAHN